MRSLDRTLSAWTSRRAVALLAAIFVAACLTVGASLVHAEGACPGSDAASPRFCAQFSMSGHALVVVPPAISFSATPERAVWLPVTDAQPLVKSHDPAASPPRAPPVSGPNAG